MNATRNVSSSILKEVANLNLNGVLLFHFSKKYIHSTIVLLLHVLPSQKEKIPLPPSLPPSLQNTILASYFYFFWTK